MKVNKLIRAIKLSILIFLNLLINYLDWIKSDEQ